MSRKNPCELEIDLFCKGMRIDPSCNLLDDARQIVRSRAGLGSGLEVVIPGGFKEVWLNVPVEEDFAYDSPYILRRGADGKYVVVDEPANVTYDIRLPDEPRWYGKKTSQGTPMWQIGVLQGSYLGIYISNSCGFWYQAQSENCKFCTTGLNVGVNEQAEKSIDDVAETALAAKEESGNTFVHFNSGWHMNKGVEIVVPYLKAVKERVGALVGVQLIPEEKLWKYDRLIDLGADHFSFCYEFHNPEWFAKLLPGKEKRVSQKRFFDAMEYTAAKCGKGRVSGEIIAGVEPLEDTLKAIDYITSVGAFPTVCVFRPTIGSDMERFPSPRYEDMLIVFEHMIEACRRNDIPIGLAPNIEVSLIVNPTDALYLDRNNPKVKTYRRKMELLRRVAYPYFKWRMRKRSFAPGAGDLTETAPEPKLAA